RPRAGAGPVGRAPRVAALAATIGGVSVVEANSVYQLAGLLAVLGDLGQRQRVDRQFTEAGDDRIELHALLDRVFIISLGVQTLCLVRNQVLKQFDRLFAMRGMLCNGRTGYVHVRAAALFEGGPHDLDGLAPFMRVGARLGVLHTADIIGIGDTDVADAAEDVARHVAIAAGRLTTQVVLDVAQPAL